MGNTNIKQYPLNRNKKQVHWKAADCPAPPGKPQLLSDADANPDLITIRWSKPSSDGGSPVTGYLVEHRRTGSPHWVRATPLLVPFPELTIGGLEPGWRYQFRICAENAVGLSEPSELSEPVTVTLQRSAVTVPRFLKELNDTVALENEKVEFVVRFLGQPAPKVCWFKDGFEIFSSRRIRIITDQETSVLTIHQAALADEGEIKCTATNRAGHIATKAQLILEAPPSIRLPRQYEDGLLFEIGELMRLKVSLAGRPTPLVVWMHNGEIVENNERYEIENDDKSCVLKINEATRSDRGEYQIKATNKLGDDIASFLVTVTDKPSPPGKALVVMTLGKSVTLSWSIPSDDGGCKIGNYIVEYYRLGWDVWLKAATSRQLTTILGDLIEGSEYKFRIKAESPYGVSEPGEESETIFIPDPKRGTVQKEPRGRSHPRDDPMAPVAAKRKNKRSESSSRADELSKDVDSTHFVDIVKDENPKRPDRSKLKSPPKTPDLSLDINRKEVDTMVLNKSLFDRSSMARELAYGSPEIKIKKELDYPSQVEYSTTSSERSLSTSPILTRKDDETSVQSVSPEPQFQEPDLANKFYNQKHPRKEKNENFTGSSEFMLVLYSDDNPKGHGSTSDIVFDFDENTIPPPISLSAPELNIEPPEMFFNLKRSSSSTEILHEKTMLRLYEASKIEEAELEKRRNALKSKNQEHEIPEIKVFSEENNEMTGLEKSFSFRRRLSASGIAQQTWNQRRHSLKNPSDLVEITENITQKTPTNLDVKREVMMLRQRSESEEKEEEAFAMARERMTLQGQSSFEKRKITVAEESNWDEEYEESISEEESESSEDERITNNSKIIQSRNVYDDDEEEIYHPGPLRSPVSKPIEDHEPFEILTVRKNPPDPNFVPKPILKRNVEDSLPLLKTKTRSHSPIPQNLAARKLPEYSMTAIEEQLQDKEENSELSTSKSDDNELAQANFSYGTTIAEGLSLTTCSIAAVAQITGITAASIVIPNRLLEKKGDAEEKRVVIDHYGEIVKNYGGKRKPNTPLYLDKNVPKDTIETEYVQNLPTTSKTDKAEILETNQKERLPPKANITTKDLVNKVENNKEPELISMHSKETTLLKEPPQVKSNKISLNENAVKEKKSRFGNRQRGRSTPHQSPARSKTPTKSPLRPKTPSKSPVRTKTQSKSPVRSKLQSKSPVRSRNWSPIKSSVMQQDSLSPRSKSPSPIPLAQRRPMLREIMTQTSVGLETNELESVFDNQSPKRQSEVIAQTNHKVRTIFDYVTDLAMFAVACWFYIFNNELLAVPFLFITVYRQLRQELSKLIPNWIRKRLNRKKQ